jgi:tetratricopeptide (TPR) repeat protein
MSARKLDDNFAQAWSLSGLGGAQEMAPDWSKAIDSYEEALRLWRACNDRLGEMLGLHNLGNAYREVARLDESLHNEMDCLAIAEEVGNRRMEGAALFGMGMTHVLLSKFAEAIEYLRRAIEASRQDDDKHTAARTTRYLADVYNQVGLTSDALRAYQEAKRVQRSIGDQRGEADTLMGLGAAELTAGDRTAASHSWRSARDIFVALNEPLLCGQVDKLLQQAGLE